MSKNQVYQANRNTSLVKILTNKDVLIAIASTLFLLIIFQLGAHVTAPGIKLNNYGDNNILSLLNLLGGGGLRRSSLFAVGISPYVTSQIIIQMLSSDIIKPLSDLKKAGERGRKKIELYTRLITLPFAVATAYGTLVLISNSSLGSFIVANTAVKTLADVPASQKAFMVIMFVSGTYISLFIADIISKKGVGNGTTLVIMSGIISGIPENLKSAFFHFITKQIGIKSALINPNNFFTKSPDHIFIAIATFIIYLFFYLLVILMIVFINGSVRKIPIQQTGQGLVTNPKELPFLPIKLIPAGVIPVVFASSLMSLPGIIGEMIKNTNPEGNEFINRYLSLTSVSGLIIYASLIFIFSFFYSHIQVNAEKLTEGFEKSGRFIPGINIGQATYNHIRRVIQRINWIGTPFLTLFSILPNILTITAKIPPGASIGGIGVIIMVSGAVQLWDSIKSTATSVKYVTQKQGLQEQIQLNYDLLMSDSLKKPQPSKSDSRDRDYMLW